jgi:orotidine-5'-phosphate decarboxylase
MTREQIIGSIKLKKSFLCVGLDSDKDLIPPHLLEHKNPIFEFNKAIIDATKDFCVAYKPNTAFYELPDQYPALYETFKAIPKTHLAIADAKRADIGNTSGRYARVFLDDKKGFGADAITLHPYMGFDSVSPFINGYENKWVILLALTSNSGAADFELLPLEGGDLLFEQVMKTAIQWASPQQMMFVVGATQTTYISRARKIAPRHFFLVPGIGAQGGNLQEVFAEGANDEIGLIVNAGRSIIYADNSINFAEAARDAAFTLQQEMKQLLAQSGHLNS